MRKAILTSVAFMAMITACHRKTVPAAAHKEPDFVPAPLDPGPARPVYTTAAIDAGKVIYETKCARCHAPKPVENYTVDRWVGILRSMVPRTRLDSVQTHNVTAYVNTNAKKS